MDFEILQNNKVFSEAFELQENVKSILSLYISLPVGYKLNTITVFKFKFP